MMWKIPYASTPPEYTDLQGGVVQAFSLKDLAEGLCLLFEAKLITSDEARAILEQEGWLPQPATKDQGDE